MISTAAWLLLCWVVLVISAQNLKCYTCEGKCDCRDPRDELCPDSTYCYTVRSLADRKVMRRGCAPSCKSVNVLDNVCALCRGSFCNMEPNENYVPYTNFDECQSNEDAEKINSQPIGQDLRPVSRKIGQRIKENGGLGEDLSQAMLVQGQEEIFPFNRPLSGNGHESPIQLNTGVPTGEAVNVNPGADTGDHTGNGAVLDGPASVGNRVGFEEHEQIGKGVNYEPGFESPAAASANTAADGASLEHTGHIGTGRGQPTYGPAPSVIDGIGTGAEFYSSTTTATFSMFMFIVTIFYKQLFI